MYSSGSNLGNGPFLNGGPCLEKWTFSKKRFGQSRYKTKPAAGKGCRISCLVDQTPNFSNLLEDLWKVERFAQYIENQASENMAEMEG